MGAPAKSYHAYEHTDSVGLLPRAVFIVSLFGFPIAFGPWGFFGVVAVGILVSLWMVGGSATVGADGVLVGSRFIPFSEIQRVERIEETAGSSSGALPPLVDLRVASTDDLERPSPVLEEPSHVPRK